MEIKHKKWVDTVHRVRGEIDTRLDMVRLDKNERVTHLGDEFWNNLLSKIRQEHILAYPGVESFYSKLANLKIDMISEATRDARVRAEKIAKNSSSDLGKLLNGHMGVFQITAKHSTEKYTWGGTHNKTSRYKTAHVTMKLTHDVQ